MTKIDKKKAVKLLLVFMITLLLIFIIWCVHTFFTYKSFSNSEFDYNLRMMQHPFYNDEGSFDFVVKDESAKMRIWCENFTGKLRVKLINMDIKATSFDDEYRMCDEHITFGSSGRYRLEYTIENYTGGLYLGLDNIYRLKSLPNDNYKIIKSNEEKGFNWDYILYTPKEIKNNHLLVSPNNTGTVDDDMLIHRSNAIGLAEWKSHLADELGVPLLVPIFPRPESNGEIYTHALDRNSLLTNIYEIMRLDLQLVAMIDDCKTRLIENGIVLDDKILMWGFSASGDFVDRFSFLHPELVKAAVFGGCDNMVPLKKHNGEKLPYPIGIYDYKDITGREFDREIFEKIARYCYKGAEDKGGWQTVTDNGRETTYEWKDYYEQFIVPALEEKAASRPAQNFSVHSLDDTDKEVILYSAFDKNVLVDRFKYISVLYEDENIQNNTFRVYENIGHEINEDMYSDEIDFFKSVLED